MSDKCDNGQRTMFIAGQPDALMRIDGQPAKHHRSDQAYPLKTP